MSNTDIILLIPLAWGTFRGFYKGLISEITSLVALGIAVYLSMKFYNAVAIFLSAHIHSSLSQFYLSIASFAILFILFLVVIHFISKRIEKMIEKLHLGFLNHFIGGVFGFIKWVLLLSVVLYFLNLFYERTGIVQGKYNESWLYKELSSVIPLITTYKT